MYLIKKTVTHIDSIISGDKVSLKLAGCHKGGAGWESLGQELKLLKLLLFKYYFSKRLEGHRGSGR